MTSHLRVIARTVPILVALALFAGSRAAAALDLSDPASELRMPITVPGAQVCAAFPAAIRNPADCPNLAIPLPPAERFASQAQNTTARLAAMVFVVMPGAAFFFTVIHAQRADQHDLSDALVADSVQGARGGMAGKLGPSVQMVGGTSAPGPFTVRRQNGVQVIRHVVELIVPPNRRDDITERVVLYHLVGRQGPVSIMFFCNADRLGSLESTFDALVAGVQLPPALPARNTAYDISYRAGHLAGQLCCVVVAVGLIVGLIVFAVRKKKT